ncbi:MAG: hypothetical protein ACRESU_05170, partial [Gammaproteobacteria bacterium]
VDNQLMSFEKLAESFDMAKLGHSPAHFDHGHLLHWQKMAIAEASDTALWEWMKHGNSGVGTDAVENLVPPDKWKLFVETVRPNVLAASQIKPDYRKDTDVWFWAVTLFGNEDFMMDDGRKAVCKAGVRYFNAALICLEETNEYKSFVKSLAHKAVVKGPDLYMPLRAALTGDTHGPELRLVWELLGTERIRKRFESAIAIAKN